MAFDPYANRRKPLEQQPLAGPGALQGQPPAPPVPPPTRVIPGAAVPAGARAMATQPAGKLAPAAPQAIRPAPGQPRPLAPLVPPPPPGGGGDPVAAPATLAPRIAPGQVGGPTFNVAPSTAPAGPPVDAQPSNPGAPAGGVTPQAADPTAPAGFTDLNSGLLAYALQMLNNPGSYTQATAQQGIDAATGALHQAWNDSDRHTGEWAASRGLTGSSVEGDVMQRGRSDAMQSYADRLFGINQAQAQSNAADRGAAMQAALGLGGLGISQQQLDELKREYGGNSDLEWLKALALYLPYLTDSQKAAVTAKQTGATASAEEVAAQVAAAKKAATGK
jgi:hypothetical protein